MAITVLLVDDHKMMRKAIAHLLAGDPEIRLVAESISFAQTIKFAQKLHPQVIVLDLHMPDERTVPPSEVKSCLNGSRLIGMSIWTDNETKCLAESMGAVTLLDKSKLAHELIPAIKQCATE